MALTKIKLDAMVTGTLPDARIPDTITIDEAANFTVSANNSTNETVYPIFVDGATGTQGAETDTGFTYNPSSGNLTIAGQLAAATLDVSGNVDIDGTLETDALTIDGTTLAETIADTVGAMVGSNTETGIAVTYEDSDNTLDFALSAAQPGITSVGTLGNTDFLSNSVQIRAGQVLVSESGGSQSYLYSGGSFTALRTTSSHPLHLSANYSSGDDALVIGTDKNATFAGAITINTSDSEQLMFKGATSPYLRFYESTTAKAYMQWHSDGYLNLENSEASTNLAVGANGIGIGTTSPSKNLHIKNTASEDTGIIIENTNNAQNLDIDYWNNAGAVQGRIRYAEGAGDISFFPNAGASEPLIIKYDGKIGVGTTAPNNELVVSSSSGPTLAIGRESTIADTGVLGNIVFMGSENSGSNWGLGAQIRAKATQDWTEGSAEGTKLEFFTTDNSSATRDLRMTIDHDGTAIFAGNGSFSGVLECGGAVTGVTADSGANDLIVGNTSGEAGMSIICNTDSATYIDFREEGESTGVKGRIMYDHSANNRMQLWSGGSATITLDGSSNSTFAGDINTTNHEVVHETGFGYDSSTYKVIQFGGDKGGNKTISLGYDPSGNSNGSFAGSGDEILTRNTVTWKTPNDANNGWHVPLAWDDGNVTMYGKLGVGATPTYTIDAFADTTLAVLRIRNDHESHPQGFMLQFTDAAPDNNTQEAFKFSDTGNNRCIIWSDGDVNNSDNAYGSLSDARAKQGIRDANSQWDDIKAIKVRNFKKTEDVLQYGDKAWEQIGVVAQELEESGMDKLVREHPADEFEIANNEDINEGDMVKSVVYSIIYMKAIKALQEAMAKIETLESKVTALENA